MPTPHITKTITLSLTLRSIGAMIFDTISDRFGRKWPLVFNMAIMSMLEPGSGFAKSFSTFLVLRGLLGIAMGGIWSLSMSNALENLPPDSRGPASGVVQQGYPLGSLLATVLNLALVSQTKVGWRALFWCASACRLFIVAIRAFVPESRFFVDVKEREGIQPVSDWQKTCTFVKVIYGIILNTGMTFVGHGSQDLYSTYLQTTKGLSARSSNLATIIGSCGGIAGGILSGFLSQYFGRRLTMISCSIFVLLFIPLWILPSPFHVLAFGVGLQFAVGDISGILAEISPPAFRAFFTGVVHSDDGL